jgi:voltage-gated potassium channel
MLASLHLPPRVAGFLDYSLAALIVLNVAATILQTVVEIDAAYGSELAVFEVFSVVVFSIEYLTRVWFAPRHPSGRFTRPILGRLRFAFTPMALVDLVAILPFYLGFFLKLDLRFLRALRLVRVFKLSRHSSAMDILLTVLRQEARSFGAALSILLVILILASSGMYLVEHDAQPEAFGSIPAAMWWAVATLTTVGYGDVTPVTVPGKLFGSMVTVVGVGMVALPAGILSSAFSDHLRRQRAAAAASCPHCGKPIDRA